MSTEERARAREILDLQEGRSGVALLDDRAVSELLRTARRIAVVGASSDPFRPSYGVFEYLLRHGYACVPVNPNAREVQGVPAFADLAGAVAAGGPFDIVDVFRRPDSCAELAAQAVALGARALWLQLGVVSVEAARTAAAGGLDVVMDRCISVEHRRMLGSRAG